MPAEALVNALRHIWGSLETLHVPAALMGGLALAVWKHVRATRDVDLLLSLAGRDPDALLGELKKRGFRPRRAQSVVDLGTVRAMQLLYEPPQAFMDLQVDLLFAETDYHLQALARRAPARLPGMEKDIYVLSCEDLIIHKLLAGRIIDRADSSALLKINRPSVDLDYLKRWVDHLALQQEWSLVWKDALPSEPLP